jgi:chemotaxis response regulator CheB/chemotaxis methyl-accepting protein methylase
MEAIHLKDDKEVFEAIARKISGITGVQLGEKQASLVFSRLSKHLRNLGGISAREYWDYLSTHESEEIPVLISLLTTHHTFFFREQIHFEFLEKELPRLVQAVKESGRNTLRVWCAACSHGQEGYSIAMFLDYHLKQLGSDIGYKIIFSDVDQESVRIAGNGIYRNDELNRVPLTYRSNHWSRGTGKVADFSRIKSRISQNCEFKVINLLELDRLAVREPYDVIFVRNVFIYFTSAEIERITNNLVKHMEPHALLFIGVSESLMGLNIPVDHIGKSIYQLQQKDGEKGRRNLPTAPPDSERSIQSWLRRREQALTPTSTPAPASTPATAGRREEDKVHAPSERLELRVITLQRTLQIGFHVRQVINNLPGFKSAGFEVIASAEEAFSKIQQKNADLLVVEAGAARYLSHIFSRRNIPTLIVPSPGASIKAQEYPQWPHVRFLEQDLKTEKEGQRETLARALEQLAKLEIHQHQTTTSTQLPNLDSNFVVAIGASTGGTEALSRIIADLPSNMPPILIVQHIPEGFSRAFAERLNQISHLRVKEAADGDTLDVGQVLVAAGDRQMAVTGRAGHYKVHVYSGEKVNGHRPSVDVLFRSVAECVKGPTLGLILTGMGADGAEGLLLMRKNGAITFGQDASTSVVYGMPKVAHQIGAVSKVLPLPQIASEMIKALTLKEKP